VFDVTVPFGRDRLDLKNERGSTRRSTTAMLSMIVVVGLLAACGTKGDDDPISATTTGETTTSLEPSIDAPTTDAPTTDAPVDDPTQGSLAFPENTAPQMRRGSGEAKLVLTDVRVAEHEGFDRIVLEFSGAGTPGWAVNYVDEAVLDGSGEVVSLGGDTMLDIYASDTTWPASDYYSGPRRLGAKDGSVTDVYVVGTFEGYTQVLAGIDGVPSRSGSSRSWAPPAWWLTSPPKASTDISLRTDRSSGWVSPRAR